MLKKKKGNNTSSNSSSGIGGVGNSISSGSSSGSKVRSPPVIPVVADLDSGGFDDSSTATCSNKSQFYSTTV